jgi:peroxidase
MALQFRTIDGSNNNRAGPTMNQAGTDFARVGPANFPDGVNALTPVPNPREISNIVVAQADAGENGPRLMDDQGIALAWGRLAIGGLSIQSSACRLLHRAIHASAIREMDCFAEPVIGCAFARPAGSQ